MTLDTLLGFALAAALGFLVGMERAFNVKGGFAGTRTFILISFLGALSYFFSAALNNWYIFTAVLLCFFIIVIASYYISAKKGYFGITTELTAFIVFIIGAMAMSPEYQTHSVILVVAMVLILALKTKFRGFIKHTTKVELFDTIKFLIIAFVVLPILPKESLDQLLSGFALYEIMPTIIKDMLAALNLHEIWLLIVLYAATGYIGYFFIKLFGEKRGLYLNGFLAGFTSSSAVNDSLLEFSVESKTKKITLPLLATLILANLSSLIRILILVSLVSYDLTQRIAGPIAIIILFNLIAFVIVYFICSQIEKFSLNISNPLNMRGALRFGGIFIIIIVASELALKYLGNLGLYLIAIVSAPFQTSGYILNVASLIDSAQIIILTAYIAVGIVLIASAIGKGLQNLLQTRNKFTQYSIIYYLSYAIVTLVSFWLLVI